MPTSSAVGPSMPFQKPYPSQQLFILGLARICEPIAFMSIFPYVYFMVESFKLTTNDKQVAMYAGLVTAAFTLAEFFTGLIWIRISDRVGRKPILITGLIGTGLSMLMFGFAPNLPVALLARALGGLLNGNVSVLATTVGELITVKEHQPRAYSVMPTVWCIGSILGPFIGGALAQPAINYPAYFGPNSFFARFPFLLPNLVCTAIVAISVVVAVLYLDETHAVHKYRHDRGRATGDWLLGKVQKCASPQMYWLRSEKMDNLYETQSLLRNRLPSGYKTTDSSSQEVETSGPSKESLRLAASFRAKTFKPDAIKTWSKQVVLNIMSIAVLAYHTITFDSLLGPYLSTPDVSITTSLPFRFTGGFGFSQKEVGFVMTVQGFYSLFALAVLFPRITRKFGTLTLFRFLAITYPLIYILTPYLVLLPHGIRTIGIYGIIVWKCTFAGFAFPLNAILIRNAAPSTLVLGTILATQMMTASMGRAAGPTISGYLYSRGLAIGVSGLVWWVTALVSIAGGIISMRLTESSEILSEKSTAGPVDLEAASETESLLDDLPQDETNFPLIGESVVSDEEALQEEGL